MDVILDLGFDVSFKTRVRLYAIDIQVLELEIKTKKLEVN